MHFSPTGLSSSIGSDASPHSRIGICNPASKRVVTNYGEGGGASSRASLPARLPSQTVEKPDFSVLMLTYETKMSFTVHMP